MSDAKEIKFSLKVMINKKKNKVLFAEADSDFIDVLISFLTLPLGTIVRVLKKHYEDELHGAPSNIGSLTTLYNGLSNLDNVHFWTEGCKDVLLNPKSSFEAECLKLKLDISETQPIGYFICKNNTCKANQIRRFPCLSIYYDTATCCCGVKMKRELLGQKESRADEDAGGVFTNNAVPFIISDDLRILPNMKGYVQTLRDLDVTDTNGAELRNVSFGFNETMDLLKGSLLSRTPLTDLILNKSPRLILYEPGVLPDKVENEATSKLEKMNLKLILQKSNNKLLFAQAENDFVDFLFTFLAIPLGGVECLLGSNTCLTSIDNLYKSVADFIEDKYLSTAGTKNMLMNPLLHHGYIPENQILPLSERSLSPNYASEWGTINFSSINFVKGQGKYVMGPRMYKINDDLTVTPFCMSSAVSILECLKIPLSDIDEMELKVGLEEALSILKASLISTSALTDGLIIDQMLKKQPKQED